MRSESSIILVVIALMASWAGGDPPKITPDPWHMRVGGVEYELVVIEEPRSFAERSRRRQDAQAAGDPTPLGVKGVSEITRGVEFSPVVLFSGCAKDAEGRCDLRVTYRLYTPAGTLALEQGGIPVWVGPAPSLKQPRHLSIAFLPITMEPSDPDGEHLVVAEIRDEVAGTTATLKRPLTLLADPSS